MALRAATLVTETVSSRLLARFCSSGTGNSVGGVAREMVKYALVTARSRGTGDWHEEAIRVLEQGATNLRDDSFSVGVLSLAQSTLLYERGNLQEAAEKLEMIYKTNSALELKVAAWEGLVGLHIESDEDSTSSTLVDDPLDLMTKTMSDMGYDLKLLKLRISAVQDLMKLVNGDTESDYVLFNGSEYQDVGESEYSIGNAVLSCGQYAHCSGNFSSAKIVYERIIRAFEMNAASTSSYVAAANMTTEEAFVGASCALGQLLSHSGDSVAAEELLTKALVRAEDHFGSTHPKVGVILTCLAQMYKLKAELEGSSSLVIQEGLYRRALELLKAPPLDLEAAAVNINKRDIISLCRGGYAEVLRVQRSRKEEGERMKKWAERAWRNRRLSLSEALDLPGPCKANAVVDTRVFRVI